MAAELLNTVLSEFVQPSLDTGAAQERDSCVSLARNTHPCNMSNKLEASSLPRLAGELPDEDAPDARQPGLLAKKLQFDTVASSSSNRASGGADIAAGINRNSCDRSISEPHLPASVSAFAAVRPFACALGTSAAQPLLGPWRALDTTLQPLQPFASISSLEAALAYTASLSKVSTTGTAALPLSRQGPKAVSGALAASSSHVRMRLNAILDNL